MKKDDKGSGAPAKGAGAGKKNAEALAAALRANLIRRKSARPPAPETRRKVLAEPSAELRRATFRSDLQERRSDLQVDSGRVSLQ